jgi:hypothetical protein
MKGAGVRVEGAAQSAPAGLPETTSFAGYCSGTNPKGAYNSSPNDA